MIIIPQKDRKGPFSLKNGESRVKMGTTSSENVLFVYEIGISFMDTLSFASKDTNFRSKMFQFFIENVALF